jgi:hypothetical protein
VAVTVTQQPRVITAEIAKQLPEILGFSPETAVLVAPWVQDQVMGVFGRFLNISIHGLTIFRAPSPWLYLGLMKNGARERLMTGRPSWRLAPAKAIEPFKLMAASAYHIPARYHAFWVPERDCWYVPYRIEPQVVQAVEAYQAKWNEHREKLIETLGEHKTAGRAEVLKAAEEAHEALRAVESDVPAYSDFMDRVSAWFDDVFPTPQSVRDRLSIEMVDKKRPDENPSQHVIETVLGIKEQVEAEARTQSALADKAENEALVAARQVELLNIRTDAERKMVEEMHRRRIETETKLIERDARKHVQPILAAIANARETIGPVIADLLESVRNGKELSASDVKRMRRIITAYELVSASEVDLDEKVIALKQLAAQPKLSRNDRAIEQAMGDIVELTSVEVARIKANAAQIWDAAFVFAGATDGSEEI